MKLENILLKRSSAGIKVKLIDFGHSLFNPPKMHMDNICGSIYYIAPEVLKKRYNSKCDMWSLGVIVFTLLTGRYPFDSPEVNKVFELILKSKHIFRPDDKRKLTKKARDFIKKLLTRKVSKRLSAK